MATQTILLNPNPAPTYLRLEGRWGTTNNGGHDLATSEASDSCISFRAKCTEIAVFAYKQTANGWRLEVDGVMQTRTAGDNTGNYGTQVVKTGLDGTAYHQYRLWVSFGAAGFQYVREITVTHDGTGGFDLTVAQPVRPKLACLGDSITRAHQGTGGDPTEGYARQLATALNRQAWNFGLDSRTMRQFDGSNTPSGALAGEAAGTVAAVLAANLTAGDVLVIALGLNDREQVGGAETEAQFEASYRNCLDALGATLDGAVKVICIGTTPRDISALSGSYANPQACMDAWNGRIQNAIAATTMANPIHWVDPKPLNLAGAAYTAGGAFVNAPNYPGGDSIHPNGTGYAVIAGALTPLIASEITSVTIDPAGPLTMYGGEGQSFEVAVEGDGDFVPDVTWTIESGGGEIDAEGNFTAPGGLAAGAQTVIVRATSEQDPSFYAEVTITVPTHAAGGGGGGGGRGGFNLTAQRR